MQYFNAEEYEFGRYREAVKTYQGAEKKTLGISPRNPSHV
jgi:ABC-type transport system involved in Fe-S cluster assembly fused permease/ATPase subunit